MTLLSETSTDCDETKRVARRNLSVVMVDASCFSAHYDYALCNSLTRLGCDVTLAHSEVAYSPWPTAATFAVWNRFYPLARWLKNRGCRRSARLTKAAEHAMGMGRLAAELERRRPDVIHFQWLPFPLVDRGYLPRLARIAPLVLTVHNTNPYHGNPRSRFNVAGLTSAFKYFSAIIVHAAFSKHRLMADGYPDAEKIHVIPHGIFEHYRGLGEQRPRAGENLVLFVGSIRPYKGVDVLVRAFAEMPRAVRENTRLLIAGRPLSAIETLKKLATSLQVDGRISWNEDVLSEDEVATLFRSATIVALPYRDVDQSAALMSALALEKPVVASRVGGIPEVIEDGVHGLLVEPDNPRMLAIAMEKLLTNQSLRRGMEAALHSLRTSKLHWENSAELTIELYRCLVSARSPKLPAACLD
jgi:glycosyltransferase involved in cell wall biosynthesis